MSEDKWFRIVVLDEDEEEISSTSIQRSDLRISMMKNAILHDIVRAIKEYDNSG